MAKQSRNIHPPAFPDPLKGPAPTNDAEKTSEYLGDVAKEALDGQQEEQAAEEAAGTDGAGVGEGAAPSPTDRTGDAAPGRRDTDRPEPERPEIVSPTHVLKEVVLGGRPGSD